MYLVKDWDYGVWLVMLNVSTGIMEFDLLWNILDSKNLIELSNKPGRRISDYGVWLVLNASTGIMEFDLLC